VSWPRTNLKVVGLTADHWSIAFWTAGVSGGRGASSVVLTWTRRRSA
jgi:hypothetical protein